MNQVWLLIMKDNYIHLSIDEPFTLSAAMGFLKGLVLYVISRQDGKYCWIVTKEKERMMQLFNKTHMLLVTEDETDLERDFTFYRCGYFIWTKRLNEYVLFRFIKSQDALEFIKGIVAATTRFGFLVSDIIVRTPFRVSYYQGRTLVQYRDIEGHQTRRRLTDEEQLGKKLDRQRIIENFKVRLNIMIDHLRELSINDDDIVGQTHNLECLVKYIPQEDDIKVLNRFMNYVIDKSGNRKLFYQYLEEGGKMEEFSHCVLSADNKITAEEFLIEYGYKE